MQQWSTQTWGVSGGAPPLCLSITNMSRIGVSSKITKDWIVTCSNFGIICSVDMTGAAIFPSHVARGEHQARPDQSHASIGVILPITVQISGIRYLPILSCDHHYTGPSNNKSLIPDWSQQSQARVTWARTNINNPRCQKLNCQSGDQWWSAATLSLLNLLPIGHTHLHKSSLRAQSSCYFNTFYPFDPYHWDQVKSAGPWHTMDKVHIKRSEAGRGKKSRVKLRMDQRIARSDPSYCSQPGSSLRWIPRYTFTLTPDSDHHY